MADHGHRNVDIVRCATCPTFLYPSDIARKDPTGEVYCLPCSLRLNDGEAG